MSSVKEYSEAQNSIEKQQPTNEIKEVEAAQPFQMESNEELLSNRSNNSFPTIPLCREEEAKQIQDFILSGIMSEGRSQTLYVAGTPGIGKTLTVTSVIEGLKQDPRYKKLFKSYYLNALNYTKPRKIYKSLLYKIFKVKDVSKTNYVAQLDYLFSTREQSRLRVIIVDELDYLLTKDQSVLYNLFEWTQNPYSKLVLITIANTFNLPETLSQKTFSRMGMQRIFFKGYSRDQIYMILQKKLQKNNAFSKEALKYACAKIVNLSCDIRRALFLLKESLAKFIQTSNTEKVEIEHVQKAFNEKIRDKPESTYVRTMPKYHKLILIQIALCVQDPDCAIKCNVRQITEKVRSFDPEVSFEAILRSLVDFKQARLIEIKKGIVNHTVVNIIHLIISPIDIKAAIEDEEFQEILNMVQTS